MEAPLEPPHFPADGSFGPGRRLALEGGTALVFATLPAGLEGAMPRWLARGTVEEGQALEPRRVFRLGGLVVKLFPPPTVFGLLRAPRAMRSARLHFACRPLRTPRPLAAFSPGRGRASLLVREFVEGRLLSEVWGARDGAAEEELARFLARMERLGVLHGDLHPGNLLWTGAEWVLLDPDGLRHCLHGRRRVAESLWARMLVYLAGEERVEELHRRALRAAGEDAGQVVVDWGRVRERAARLRARRERTLGLRRAEGLR